MTESRYIYHRPSKAIRNHEKSLEINGNHSKSQKTFINNIQSKTVISNQFC